MNKQLQDQNLRELIKLTFLNLIRANGIMAKTFIRNHQQKKRENVYLKLRYQEDKEIF